jgi:hypothetical protein
MNASLGFRRFVGLFLGVALTADGIALSQQSGPLQPSAGGQSELRWTPHRAATTADPAPAATAAPAAQPAAAQPAAAQPAAAQPAAAQPVSAAAAPVAATAPQLPPATVGLPDTVPVVTPPRRAAGPSMPMQRNASGRMGDWNSPNRTSGRFQSTGSDAPRFPLPAMSDLQVFRTPQGDTGRPMLAAEGRQRRPGAAPAAQLGGGLAPRFTPQTAQAGQPAASRPERLALNADGLPSVMAKAPQAAVLDDATAPNRLPAPSGGATQNSPAIPAPRMSSSGEPSIVVETAPEMMMGEPGLEGYGPEMMTQESLPDGMLMGEYPTEMHVESFYDDQFACEEGPGLFPCWPCDGRICAWLRQFGKPYYGWRWYRDFTASAGITSFQNQSNLGLVGNYGTNEYVNWAMPFWNAFGIGWQLGARGVQSNFQQPTIDGSRLFNARDQVFVTTGFFTRAFQGRGLQGGAVYDYLSDSYIENVDVAQIRGEISYVWGYHELGFWGAFNTTDQLGLVPNAPQPRVTASTVNLYTAFYRLHFGDANEARIWGGASDNGQGVVGATVRAPMSRSLALEGAFTYLLPDKSQTVVLQGSTVTFAPSAWNLSANLVWYPAGRARRSLSSPYRPLFDVADNGSMIRALSGR